MRFLCLLSSVFIFHLTAQTALAVPFIQNGDFETGDFSGWTPSQSGSEFGLPDIVSFDAAGSGAASNVVRFQGGGSLRQEITITGGVYNITADLALRNTRGLTWIAPVGLTLFLDDDLSDGIGLDSRLLQVSFPDRRLEPFEVKRTGFDLNLRLLPGTYTTVWSVAVGANRGSFLGATPFQYLDNLSITRISAPPVTAPPTQVSEPATLYLWLIASVAGFGRWMLKNRNAV